MPILDTQRLAIREFELSDSEFIVRLLNDEAFLTHIGDKGVRSEQDACEYLRNGPCASYSENGFGLFHVAESGSGASIGMSGLVKRANRQYPDIGYAFLPEFRSQGYAFESGAAVLEYGHGDLELAVIDAFVSPQNAPSKKLLERLGLEFLGKTELDGIESPQDMYRSRRLPARA